MNGQWFRLAVPDLETAKRDLDWALDLAYQTSEADETASEGVPPAQRRYLSVDKTWHALDYLFSRQDCPVSIVFGEEAFTDQPDADWGMGPPRYLTPDQVRQAATVLSSLTAAELVAGVTNADLAAEQIYPQVWDELDALEWATNQFDEVREFFAAAAEAGDAVICWLD